MKIELMPRTKSNVIPLFLAFIQSGASVCKSNKTSGLFPPNLIMQFELKSVLVIQYCSFLDAISSPLWVKIFVLLHPSACELASFFYLSQKFLTGCHLKSNHQCSFSFTCKRPSNFQQLALRQI